MAWCLYRHLAIAKTNVNKNTGIIVLPNDSELITIFLMEILPAPAAHFIMGDSTANQYA